MHSDRLVLAETLIVVLETGSFTDAAKKLDVSQSTVSRRIAALEDQLGGTALFRRGTRWISPTAEAESYVRDVRNIIGQLDAAEAKIHDRELVPKGLLRLSLPPAIGRAKLLAPLAQLTLRYPGLEMKIDLSEEYVDLRENTVDLAVRIHPLEQTGIVVEKIGESRIGTYAAEEYLSSASTLSSHSDLAGHQVIGLTSLFEGGLQDLSRMRRKAFSEIRPSILVNDLDAIRLMLAKGLGVGFLPDHLVEEDLEAGHLVECNVSLPIDAIELFALFPNGLRSSPRVSAALEVLRDAFVN